MNVVIHRRLMILALAAAAALSSAHWARPNLHVPISRLITNLQNDLKQKPDDPEITYLLGRLHSMAFTQEKDEVDLYGTEKQFQFPHWDTVKVPRKAGGHPLTASEKEHLRESLIRYHRAAELAPKAGLYQLGLAWMYEEAVPFASQLGKLPWINLPLTASDLTNLALTSYQRIYSVFLKSDLKGGTHIVGVSDVFVSEDAAEGILRLDKNLSGAKRAEIAKNLATLKSRVRGITPIIVSLSGDRSLGALLDPGKKVSFDLLGDGGSRLWPWVRPDTGILVWDPQGTGKITSGRQLFGSSTFWLFFRDGYAALASLDDDSDGWLTGRELRGIAMWQDGNGNGISDPGEVRPLAARGIVAVRTKPSGAQPVLSAEDGIRLANGRTLPTFDWVPTSHPIDAVARK